MLRHFLLLTPFAAMLAGCTAEDRTGTPILSTPSTPTRSTATVPTRSQSTMAQAMLAEHNAARADVGVGPLRYDENLASQALDHARNLARTGRLVHSAPGMRVSQGENLWAGTEGYYEFGQMARGWIDERRYYRHAAFPDVSTTGDWLAVGHYTQIIWRDTTHVGCGIATGMGRDWLVCRYSPSGNVVGELAY